MKSMERFLERLIFGSRWLMAPFYIGLIGALVILLVNFVQELVHIAPNMFSLNETEVIIIVLGLIDMSLAGNLLLMVIFSGYENFVSKINTGNHEDRPDWMGKVDFSGLKLKLVASVVAISAIHLLKAFMNLEQYSTEKLTWMVAIHSVFVISGVLLALMDRIEGHH